LDKNKNEVEAIEGHGKLNNLRELRGHLKKNCKFLLSQLYPLPERDEIKSCRHLFQLYFFTDRNISFTLLDNDDLLPRFVSRLPEQGDMMPMQPNMYQVEKLLGAEYLNNRSMRFFFLCVVL
jgi:hypothetical protein